MQQVSGSTLRFGNAQLDRALSPSNDGPDDWSRHTRVTFDSPFGPATPGIPKDVEQVISVVCTPRGSAAPLVAVVETVDATGFTFRVRNADPDQGADNVSVDWLAVLGVVDTNSAKTRQSDGRLSVLQPKSFDGFLEQNNWPRIWFSKPLVPDARGTPPVILLTQNDLHCGQDNPATIGTVGPLEATSELFNHAILVPGDDPNDFGFSVGASDVDTVGGNCGFYSAAFVVNANAGDSIQDWWIDNGNEKNVDSFFNEMPSKPPFSIARGGVSGDWRLLDIYFDKPFLTPPLVFASARGHTPIVCIARRVTTYGFTLAARNTDSVDGHAMFNWIAIGCKDGCG
jgi:hypothetical protein